MLTKIRVSYVHDQDLEKVIKLLQPVLKKVKVPKNNTGIYKKAYIDLKGDKNTN
ncbi:MAG: hypothetical protein ACOYIF_07270 [Acetivibrionales bacterium]